MTINANEFTELADKIKTNKDPNKTNLFGNIYTMAEEVIIRQGDTLFKDEFIKLQKLLKSRKPCLLDLKGNRNELWAFRELIKLAVEGGVVRYLTEAQKEELYELVGNYDNSVDTYVLINRVILTTTQICQIYLAQTISFYYIFEEEEELVLSGALEALLN